MMSTPAHKQLSPTKQGAQIVNPVTLADYVSRIDPKTGDLKAEPPLPAQDALEQLTIAVDNYLRAMSRIAVHGDDDAVANLRGTRLRLERAQTQANVSLAAGLDAVSDRRN